MPDTVDRLDEVARKATQIHGRPWWESGQRVALIGYKTHDALEAEVTIAQAAGYRIRDTSDDGGHRDLFGSSLSKGVTLIMWERVAA